MLNSYYSLFVLGVYSTPSIVTVVKVLEVVTLPSVVVITLELEVVELGHLRKKRC